VAAARRDDGDASARACGVAVARPRGQRDVGRRAERRRRAARRERRGSQRGVARGA
jgi:hypothetical protein